MDGVLGLGHVGFTKLGQRMKPLLPLLLMILTGCEKEVIYVEPDKEYVKDLAIQLAREEKLYHDSLYSEEVMADIRKSVIKAIEAGEKYQRCLEFVKKKVGPEGCQKKRKKAIRELTRKIEDDIWAPQE